MFIPVKNDTGAVQPWEYLAASAGSYKAGQLLNVANGQLTAISAATKTTPPYLCVGDVTVDAGGIVPVIRVTNDTVFETQLSAAAEAATVGTKLEISAGGLQADATAVGTFEVVAIEGTAAGAAVRGRFV